MEMTCDDESDFSDEDERNAMKDVPVYEPRDQKTAFCPDQYLNSFYSSVKDDSAMNTILFFMPGFAYRVPKGGALLDVGTGPTIVPALSFRDQVDHIFLSDFAASNRAALNAWWKGTESFDWSKVVSFVKAIQCSSDTNEKVLAQTREKLRAILHCDVHSPELFDLSVTEPSSAIVPEYFDVISSTFCFEYATRSREEYIKSVVNVLGRLKPGGYVFLGGVHGAGHYYFGNTRFRSFKLDKETLMDALIAADINVDESAIKYVCSTGNIFALLAQKNQSTRPGVD